MSVAVYVLAGFVVLCVAKARYPQIGYEESPAYEAVIWALWPAALVVLCAGLALRGSDRIAALCSRQ